jgi:hypothetical protein
MGADAEGSSGGAGAEASTAESKARLLSLGSPPVKPGVGDVA